MKKGYKPDKADRTGAWVVQCQCLLCARANNTRPETRVLVQSITIVLEFRRAKIKMQGVISIVRS